MLLSEEISDKSSSSYYSNLDFTGARCPIWSLAGESVKFERVFLAWFLLKLRSESLGAILFLPLAIDGLVVDDWREHEPDESLLA